MSSKTYKRKNTKSKNKKKTIKTLKKINIKRNNHRSKIRSNIRKIRGGGSIKWNSETGFEGEDISIINIKSLIGKTIKLKINNDNIINSINDDFKISNDTEQTKINKNTIIEGKIHIIKESGTNLELLIYFEFESTDKTFFISMAKNFIVCKTNNDCNTNDLSMYEIEEEIKGIKKNKKNKGKKENKQPYNIQPNTQPNSNNNNILRGVDMDMFNPKPLDSVVFVENE